MGLEKFNANNLPPLDVPLHDIATTIEGELRFGGTVALDEILRSTRAKGLDRLGKETIALLPKNGDYAHDMRRRLGLQVGADIMLTAADRLSQSSPALELNDALVNIQVPSVIDKTAESERWEVLAMLSVHGWKRAGYFYGIEELLSQDQMRSYADGVSLGIGLVYGCLNQAWNGWRADEVGHIAESEINAVDWGLLQPSDITGQQ